MLQVQHEARKQLGFFPSSTPLFPFDLLNMCRLLKNEILFPLQHPQTLHALTAQVQRRLKRGSHPRQN